MKKNILILPILLSLAACQDKPVQNVAYFQKHPEAIDAAAQKCIEKYPNAENIPAMRKDPVCKAILSIEKAHCQQFALYHSEFNDRFCSDDSFLITRNGFYRNDRALLF